MTDASPRFESLAVRRTARLAVRGPRSGPVRELWIVLHGYGQLAAPFLEGLAAVDDGSRLLVAPEALSRFYEGSVEERVKRQGEQVVGASWMTKEARLDDIADNIAYLDAVHGWCRDRLRATRGGAPPLTVLGFSQGAATAARWIAAGSAEVARHLVWGSTLPPDADLSPASPLRRPATFLVIGARDRFATEKLVAAEHARLDAAGFPYRAVRFDGGHRLDDDTLRAIAHLDGDTDATGAL
ncbi:MAG: hypothetical protein HY084_05350 [Gemmatimonadetes bacterium]|nr:hypothetical protein [Gemmatimonadota bacterium]